MTTISLSPTAVDQEDLRTQLQNILATKQSWSGYLPTQTGQTLIDFGATIAAFAHAKSMRYAQDTFAETAVTDRALYSIADMQGIRITRKGAASVLCNVSYAPTAVGAPLTVTLPRFTQFQAAGTYWYTKDAVAVSSGGTTTCTLYQGYMVDQTMNGLGTDYTTFLSPEKGFVVEDQSVYVVVNGTDIERAVDGLWNYAGFDAFLDKTTPDGRLRILFGNSAYGTKPQPADELRIVYAVTSGADANSVSTLGALVTLVQGTPHGVTLAITTNPSGGASEPSASLYKTVGAYNFGAFGAAVTRTQCIAAALNYPGIIDVKTQAQREIDPNDVRFMNTVKVVGLTSPAWTTPQKDEFISVLQTRSMYALRFYWVDPVPVPVDVAFTVYCHNWASLTQCRTDAIAAVESLFTPRKGLLGRDLPLSDIYDAIKSSNTGISYLELDAPTSAQLVSGDPLTAPVVTQLPETSIFEYATVGAPTCTQDVSGGPSALPAGNYGFVVTAIMPTGETAALKYTVITLLPGVGSTTITVAWAEYVGALNYKVYGHVPGGSLGYIGTSSSHTLPLALTTANLIVNLTQPPSPTSSIVPTPVSSFLTPLSYSYVVTAVTALGETTAQNFGSTVITTVTNVVNHLTWSPMAGALQYRVYGRNGPDYGLIAVTTEPVYDDWGQTAADLEVSVPVVTTYPAAYLTLNAVTANALFSTRV